MAKQRGTFGGLGFVMAAVGSAIGLGNIWKFPYITYANDGGSFVLVYLAAIVVIGAPIMLAEVLLGRSTQQSAIGSFRDAAKGVLGGRAWTAVGVLGVTTGFVLLSYYAVIAGWTVYYFGKCLAWSVRGFDLQGTELSDQFGEFLANGPMQLAFHSLFLAFTVAIVMLGIKDGIERVTKTLMPILGVILVLLVIDSFWAPGFGEAIRFLFHVGPLTAESALEAVGHAFFTLSLGMGGMITYGSYMSRKNSIPRASFAICLLDTLVALMACVIMFSIIFSVAADERATTFAKSSTILFTTLPRMFYEMPFGALLAPLFYVLVSFAALTSTIALLEVVVAAFVDTFGWARKVAAPVLGLAVFVVGIPAALSLGAVDALGSWQPWGERSQGVFDTFDYTVSNWFLPIGGLFTALFVGWFVSSKLSREELEAGHGPVRWFRAWQLVLRFAAPAAVLWVLWAVVGGRSFA